MRRCQRCGDELHDTSLKCGRCGTWVEDSPVFARLGDQDIELIKAKDLAIAPPSFLSFQATELILDDTVQRLEHLGIEQPESADAYFSAYLHARPAVLAAHYKSDNTAFLRERVKVEFIANALAVVFFDIASRDFLRIKRSTVDPRVCAGLRVFERLDRVREKYPASTADIFACGQEIGKIIYGDSSTVFHNVQLSAEFWLNLSQLPPAYSGYFVVDEEDFQWQTICPESSEIIQRWLRRFE